LLIWLCKTEKNKTKSFGLVQSENLGDFLPALSLAKTVGNKLKKTEINGKN
jgi:hypothetical protein